MYNLLKKMLKTGVVTTEKPFKKPPSLYRGTIDVNVKLCTHCQKCVQICPTNAIHYREQENGNFALLEFDYAKCIYCSLCVETCEANALIQTSEPKAPKRAKEGLVDSFYLPRGNLK